MSGFCRYRQKYSRGRIRGHNEPYIPHITYEGGDWSTPALPGGFVDIDESLGDAAKRELQALHLQRTPLRSHSFRFNDSNIQAHAACHSSVALHPFWNKERIAGSEFLGGAFGIRQGDRAIHSLAFSAFSTPAR